MDIKIDWKRYFEKNLKSMEKELKEAIKNGEEWKVTEILKDIDRHKERYKNIRAGEEK